MSLLALERGYGVVFPASLGGQRAAGVKPSNPIPVLSTTARLVALREIQPDDELTWDYETTEYMSTTVPRCLWRYLDGPHSSYLLSHSRQPF
jgi:hypothetical protein